MADDHLIPNTTQVPNSILDLLMPFLYDGEARVLLYLCRRIYGFQRESDSVSLEQFVHGIRQETSTLDFGAGVSRRGAINALTLLKAIGIVEQLEGGQGRSRIPVFRINRKCEMMQWLHLIAQEPDNARELIMQRLHLIRQKHALAAPIDKKPKKIKETSEKVQPLPVLEKVQPTTIKGANEFLEMSHQSGSQGGTKPSITKPRKDTPPVNAKALTSPKGDEVPRRGYRLPKDWQPSEADLAWASRKGYHTLVDLPEMTEEFCRYWWSRARDNTKLDWSMTWQNRVSELAKTERDRRARASPKPPHAVSTTVDANGETQAERILRQIREEEAERARS